MSINIVVNDIISTKQPDIPDTPFNLIRLISYISPIIPVKISLSYYLGSHYDLLSIFPAIPSSAKTQMTLLCYWCLG